MLPDQTRALPHIPVVEDLVDSNERGDIGRIIFAKYPERRRHNDFNSGPVMADGEQSMPPTSVSWRSSQPGTPLPTARASAPTLQPWTLRVCPGPSPSKTAEHR